MLSGSLPQSGPALGTLAFSARGFGLRGDDNLDGCKEERAGRLLHRPHRARLGQALWALPSLAPLSTL